MSDPTSLSDAKRALLARRLQQAQAKERASLPFSQESSRFPPVFTGESDETRVAPLSFAQQRLWFLDQLQPDHPVYNVPAAIDMRGPLDVAALERSVAAIVARHATLRTTFGWRPAGEPHAAATYPVSQAAGEDEPVQIIAPNLSIPIPVISLEHQPPAERDAAAERLAAEEARRPFDLSQGPLLRLQLLRLGPEHHRLLLTMHHIISDGWSLGIFWQELAAGYQAGNLSALPPLSMTYADFAYQQRHNLEALAPHEAYWRAELAGAPHTLDLPMAGRRPEKQDFAGRRHTFAVPDSLMTQLESVGRAQGCTLFMTLLAGWQALLYRTTRQADFLVGVPIANRTQRQAEGLIGFFVNTLPLRCRLAGKLTFSDLLQQVRATTLAAYEHQDMPFDRLVELLQPERDLSRSPLVQVMFTLQNKPLPLQLGGGAEAEKAPVELALTFVDNGTAKFDLSLTLLEGARDWEGQIEYSTALFEAASIERLAGHYVTLLTAAAARPGQLLDTLPLLTEAESTCFWHTWNATQQAYPDQIGVHHLFQTQAARTPTATAVVMEDEALTYAELDAQANHLADVLRAQGMGPGRLVGIYLERGLEMMVALLGVLKTGAAYVPLDPAFPADRLAYMLADSQAALVLTQAHLAKGDKSPLTIHPTPHLLMEALPAAISPADQPSPGGGEQLMYIIYTSGSTGRPKGVSVTHRSVVNFLLSMQQTPGLTPADVLLSVTTLSFDIAVLEIYLPLITGARLVLVSRETAMDGQLLQRQLAACGATVMQATPATWRMLLASEWGGQPDLKVLCGGEGLPHDLAQQLLTRCAELWNMYGPTETTVWSSVYQVKATDLEAGRGGTLPIGRPIANTRLVILDEWLEPTPVGIVGELYIGGDGLAQGYWGRPELTAERFMPDPGDQAGGRMYRTGDLARYRSDGVIEHLGRADFQVKVRGFRIELGEIEVALSRHPAIRQAVVVAQEAAGGDQRLMAYLIPSSRPVPTAAQLRRFLQPQLPDYMIPAHFIFVEAYPLTPNNKVDRKALMAARDSEPGHPQPAPPTAPRSPTERLLVDLWRDILKLERVGIHDNFFELGGHSLLAAQLMARIRHTLGVEIPLARLFSTPTVAGLAAAWHEAAPSRPLIAPGDRQDGQTDDAYEAPVSFAQQRLWFLEQFEPGTALYNIPLALHLRGELDITRLTDSLNQIVRRHAALRTTVVEKDGQPAQHIAPDLILAVPVEDLRSLPSEMRPAEAQQRLAAEARRPFDLSQGPLIRARLIRSDERVYDLIITLHHIISDAWSITLLMDELAALYSQTHGVETALPYLPLQYSDFARWQHHHLTTEALGRQMAYWRAALQGAPPALIWPMDHQRPALQTFHGDWVVTRLPRSLSEAINAFGRREGVTPFITLLGSFAILLARLTGQKDMVIGVPVANRDRQEWEPLIGFFVNTLPLRCQLTGNPTFREVVQRLRDVALGAYSCQDVPFEKLVMELGVKRDLARAPIFQVLFVLQNMPPLRPALAGLEVEEVDVHTGVAKYDLSLYLVDEPAGYKAAWEYNTDLFTAETIQTLAGDLTSVLTQLLAQPEKAIHVWLSTETPGPTHSPHENKMMEPRSENWEPAATDGEDTFTPPRTPLEEALVGLWADLLQVEAISVRADFFTLGGHSLLATQMLARVRQQFQVDVRLARFFTQPTIAALARLIQTDDEARASRQLVPDRGAAAARPRSSELIPRADRSQPLPLSFGQERLWYLNRLAPDSPAYHVSASMRVRGRLELTALAVALQDLVQRHEVLRTTFSLHAGRPQQMVHPLMPAGKGKHIGLPLQPGSRNSLVYHDLRALPPAERSVAAQELANQNAQAAFDLEAGPLWRLEVAQTTDEEHLLLLTAHHAIFDAWSISLFYQDLLAFYQAALGQGPTHKPELPRQYADYAQWQRQQLSGARLAELVAYWRAQLHQVPVVELPADRPRPAASAFRGGRHAWRLARDLSARLKALASQEGTTLFIVLLAGFKTLLMRLTNQTDIAVGTPVSGRTERELEPIIGFFVNTLVLRTQLAGRPTYRQLIGRVREVFIQAYTHQELPFEKLVEELQPPRQPGYNPLFQVMFTLENAAPLVVDAAYGLHLEPFETEVVSAHFDLTLFMAETDEGLEAALDYNRDLFDAATITRLAGHLETLLTGAVDDPDRPVTTLPLLTAGERAQLRQLWQGQPTFYPELADDHATLHQLVQVQAARTPYAVAVVQEEWAGPPLTYADLQQGATRLACYLQGAGVQPGDRVAISMERRPEMIIAVLGVLQAGAAYVPIDPNTPPQRFDFILRDTQARRLLTAGPIPAWPTHPATLPHDDITWPWGYAPTADDQGTPRPITPVDGDALAYIMYTSGSTGVPKGVMVSHRSVLHLTLAFRDAHHFAPGDRLLVIPPLSFDASVGDIFPALISGATLVLHPRPGELTGAALSALGRRLGITAIDTAASLWRQWVEDWETQGLDDPLPGLRCMMVGGERVPLDRLAVWHRLTRGRVAFYNHYGPTEATVCATLYQTLSGQEITGLTLPIGRPLPHVRAIVALIGEEGDVWQEAPIGVPGELLIGGPGVAWGYLNRPEATAEAFVPDPYQERVRATADRHDTGRLYRTGDIVRYRPDGTLEFLGRRDEQIKVRGFRIEPGEIETALRQHPAVRESVVVAREDRLVAYIVAHSEAETSEGPALRHFLSAHLPAYMLPSTFIWLDNLPLTPNGKVDRRALPGPEEGDDFAARPTTAPRSPTEKQLAAIWARLLGVQSVGVWDDFFEMGGESLLALQLVSAINQHFGVGISLPRLFETPTVAGMAAEIDRLVSWPERAGEEIDWAQEAQLERDIQPRPTPRWPKFMSPTSIPDIPAIYTPQVVLLTGATGFLGAYLLRELLRQTPATVICLVRAETVAAGRQRLDANMEKYGLGPEAAWEERILPLPGDLGAPRLGLTEAAWEELAGRAEIIYHNGALVHFAYPYRRLQGPNVRAVRDLLRLAVTGHTRPVHFVSTLGLFLTPAYAGQTVAEGVQPDIAGLERGYEQSKWVAEQLIQAARQRGLPASIYRLARVTGDSQTGACHGEDFFYSLLRGCLQLGSFPDEQDPVDMLPVDYVSQAIVTLSRRPAALGNDFHFYNHATVTFPQLAQWLETMGHELVVEAPGKWVERMRQAVAAGRAEALRPFAALFDDAPTLAHPHFDTPTMRQLAAEGLPCPPVDAALVRRYLDYLGLGVKVLPFSRE